MSCFFDWVVLVLLKLFIADDLPNREKLENNRMVMEDIFVAEGETPQPMAVSLDVCSHYCAHYVRDHFYTTPD